MRASNLGPLKIVTKLVNYGVNLNAKNIWGNTALMLMSLRGHSEIVKFLLERKADINAVNQFNASALTWARENRKPDMVELLLENGAV
jgi:ankyrin repeat protein